MTVADEQTEQAGGTWPKITMYTTSWCGDCKQSKRFLSRAGIPFEEIDIEDVPEAAEIVKGLNNGRRRVPTILIEGGPTLAEPSDRELGHALGLG